MKISVKLNRSGRNHIDASEVEETINFDETDPLSRCQMKVHRLHQGGRSRVL
jgi:hypothetical protein